LRMRDDKTVISAIRVIALAIDDGSKHLDTFIKYLETIDARISVDRVTSTFDALKKLEISDYDVFICDYIILGMNGLGFLEKLRNQGNHMPFIFFSDDDNENEVITILNLEKSQFIRKRTDQESYFNDLLRVITSAVEYLNYDRSASR